MVGLATKWMFWLGFNPPPLSYKKIRWVLTLTALPTLIEQKYRDKSPKNDNKLRDISEILDKLTKYQSTDIFLPYIVLRPTETRYFGDI